MKISELIKLLKQFEKEHGDVQVVLPRARNCKPVIDVQKCVNPNCEYSSIEVVII